ncbi:unnamed protein product [Soboliphyme baturini]|uniref:PhoLip_ATPase_C domain-containing protein n=1 Tax=Soboliphyme baturini TaxID=241478 RepID=A0A183IA43_9BILA|nr:unnamed protein product [Soboliphyme baturini]
MLLPSMIGHAVAWCLITVSNVFLSNGNHSERDSMSNEQLIYFQYFFYVIVLIQGLLHPLFCTWNLTLVTPGIAERLPFFYRMFISEEDRDRDRNSISGRSLPKADRVSMKLPRSVAELKLAEAATVRRFPKDSCRTLGKAPAKEASRKTASNSTAKRAMNAYEYVPLNPISEAVEEEQNAEDDEEDGDDLDDEGDLPDTSIGEMETGGDISMIT